MLKKLLKYELISIFKTIWVFYAIAAVAALFTRLFFALEQTLAISIVAQIFSGALISMIINIIINTAMRLWVRFKQNFYGDESYLTHTLPVKKQQLLLSKTLCGVIVIFVGFFVCGLCACIAYSDTGFWTSILNVLSALSNNFGASKWLLAFAFLFLLFIELLHLIQTGFFGILVGHRFQNAKTGLSIVFALIIYSAVQILLVILIALIAAFYEPFRLFLTTNSDIITMDATMASAVKILFLICIFFYCGVLVALYFVNLKIFKKGVEVE